MIVREMMNPNPAKISPEESLAKALEEMGTTKTRHLVVVTASGEVIGIISDSDLAMFYDPVEMPPEKWNSANVSQLMTSAPVTIGSGATVSAAATLLLKTAVSALPVVDNGMLIGILTETDFVRHFARGDQN